MLKRVAKSVALALLALLLVAPAVVLAYTYFASFSVTEGNGTDYDMLAVLEPSNNDWMADNGFMDADALDTTVETLGGLVKPHMVADDKTFTAIPVPADSQTNLYFTTGNTPAASMDIIAGYDGYVTIDHDANLELGNEATIDFKGYVDTTAIGDVNILSKTDAYLLYVDAPTSITSRFYWVNTEILRPDGHNTCVIPLQNGAACNLHWQNVDEVVADDIVTTVHTVNGAAEFIDYYTLDDTAIPVGTPIVSVRAYNRGNLTIGNGWFATDLKLGANLTLGTIRNPNNVWTSYNELLARPGGGAWAQADLDGLLISARIKEAAGSTNYLTQEYIEVSYLDYVDVTVTGAGVTSQIMRVVADLDPAGAGTMTLSVYDDDGAHLGNSPQNVGMGGNSVLVEAGSDWILMSNATPYLEYYSHSTIVGGWSEKILYEPTGMVVVTAFDGIADAGSDTDTIIDAELTQANDYWIGALVTITEAGAAAPEGETSICTAFAAATDEVTVTPAFTAGVGAGDSYTIDFGTLVNENNPGTYDGRITWGVNPTGVAVTLGSMISTAQPSVGVDTTAPSVDILPGIGVSDWYVEPAVGGSLLTNPLRPLVLLLVADPVPGSPSSAPLTEIQAWRLLALAAILFITVAAGVAVRSHLFIAGVAAGAAIGGAVALTIFPLWALVFAVGAVAAGVVAERSPSL